MLLLMTLRSTLDAVQALRGKLGSGGGPVTAARRISSGTVVVEFEIPAIGGGGLEKSIELISAST